METKKDFIKKFGIKVGDTVKFKQEYIKKWENNPTQVRYYQSLLKEYTVICVENLNGTYYYGINQPGYVQPVSWYRHEIEK